jgi:lipoate-protein ligase B
LFCAVISNVSLISTTFLDSMSTAHILRHAHLPSITPFTRAQNIQTTLVAQFLSHKAAVSSQSPPSPLPFAPQPTLLTFTPTPVYTTGRRELGTLSPTQITSLKKPLPNLPHDHGTEVTIAEVYETLRGGQITFHGPGQLVIYPILDLKGTRSTTWPRGLSARCYVHLLEETTIKTLAYFDVRGVRTNNPGVWIDDDTKIAALGVHLRRNVASYGVGLNVSTDIRWFDRIVACGLEGKKTTSMMSVRATDGVSKSSSGELKPTEVATLWANEFAKGLWGEEGRVERVEDDERLDDLLERN